MAVEVVAYSPDWPDRFDRVAVALADALRHISAARIEHVGSTSVPGLAAKPIIDIDVIVSADEVPGAVSALCAVGYVHLGELGIPGREALRAPDRDPRRNVYVCIADGPAVRNHLAVRDVLRNRPDLRDRYAAVKLALAADPGMDIDSYVAGKSLVLQDILAESDLLTAAERRAILTANAGTSERSSSDTRSRSTS